MRGPSAGNGTIGDLIEFLRARLDEDEADARAVEGDGSWDVPSTGVVQLGGVDDLDGLVMAPRNVAHHIARHDPARVLRTVEALRQIVELHLPTTMTAGYGCMYCGERGACTTVRLLALPYADHADYRAEWRP